jgi:hypothetical protein
MVIRGFKALLPVNEGRGLELRVGADPRVIRPKRRDESELLTNYIDEEVILPDTRRESRELGGEISYGDLLRKAFLNGPYAQVGEAVSDPSLEFGGAQVRIFENVDPENPGEVLAKGHFPRIWGPSFIGPYDTQNPSFYLNARDLFLLPLVEDEEARELYRALTQSHEDKVKETVDALHSRANLEATRGTIDFTLRDRDGVLEIEGFDGLPLKLYGNNIPIKGGKNDFGKLMKKPKTENNLNIIPKDNGLYDRGPRPEFEFPKINFPKQKD